MIKLTEEMETAFAEAYVEAWNKGPDGARDIPYARRCGLRAVLAIVDQERGDTGALVRSAYERGQQDERTLTRLLGPPPTGIELDCTSETILTTIANLSNACDHVFVDGVGNETDTCQRCGVPE